MPSATNDPIGLSNRVRQVREALGLTQKQLAVRAGLSRPTIISAEQGDVRSVAVMVAITRALGCEWSHLWQLDDEQKVSA